MIACVLPVAVVTLEGLGAGVLAVVPSQLVAAGKAPLAAFPGAFVRLLTCRHVTHSTLASLLHSHAFTHAHLCRTDPLHETEDKNDLLY